MLPIFQKILCSKVKAKIPHLKQLRHPSAVFFHEIIFYASFEAYTLRFQLIAGTNFSFFALRVFGIY